MSAHGITRLKFPRKLRATRAGWCFVTIILGVGFAALNTGNNLLYLVLALMLAFLVLSGLLSEFALRGLRVERHLPREIFAGSENRVVLRIQNDQKWFPAFAILAEDRTGDPRQPSIAGRCFTLRIGPEQKSDRSYLWTPKTRGTGQFISCRLSTRFPFGLFVKSAEISLDEKYLAYPELYPELPPEAASEDIDSAGSDEEMTEERGRSGDDLAGLREYQRGDPTRRLHWPSSMRTGRLIVGEQENAPTAEVDVLLELSASLSEAETEQRISCAATQVVLHLQSGKRVGLKTASSRFVPAAGTTQRTLLLTHLSQLTHLTQRRDEALP